MVLHLRIRAPVDAVELSITYAGLKYDPPRPCGGRRLARESPSARHNQPESDAGRPDVQVSSPLQESRQHPIRSCSARRPSRGGLVAWSQPEGESAPRLD